MALGADRGRCDVTVARKAKAKQRPRGRPPNPNARRRQGTRAGRRGEDTTDHGTRELRGKKRRYTTRTDLPIDAAGILLGHRLIDDRQYSTLASITGLLQSVARAWGGRD